MVKLLIALFAPPAGIVLIAYLMTRGKGTKKTG